MSIFKRLFSKRYIAVTILVLVAMAVMVRLGIWQLDRRQQRIAANADIMAKLEQPPQSLNEAALGQWQIPDDRTALRNTQVTASGSFDYDHQVLLLQQPLESRPGMHLVAPLRLAGTDQAVLVDRGWIPEEDIGDLAQFDEATDQVSVTGLLQPSQILYGRAARNAESAGAGQAVEPQTQWYRLDVEAIQEQIPYSLLPAYLLQAPPPEGNVALPIRVMPEFDLSEGPHMSYALQWFSFAIIAGIVYVSVVRKREREAQTETVETREEDVPVPREAPHAP